MSGTALYRALVHAGAPEDEAKEASDVVDDKFNSIDERLTKLDTMTKINTAILIAILLKSFF